MSCRHPKTDGTACDVCADPFPDPDHFEGDVEYCFECDSRADYGPGHCYSCILKRERQVNESLRAELAAEKDKNTHLVRMYKEATGEITRQSVPCPDNKPGCAVHHFERRDWGAELAAEKALHKETKDQNECLHANYSALVDDFAKLEDELAELKATLAEYEITRSTGREWLASIERLKEELAAEKAAHAETKRERDDWEKTAWLRCSAQAWSRRWKQAAKSARFDANTYLMQMTEHGYPKHLAAKLAAEKAAHAETKDALETSDAAYDILLRGYEVRLKWARRWKQAAKKWRRDTFRVMAEGDSCLDTATNNAAAAMGAAFHAGMLEGEKGYLREGSAILFNENSALAALISQLVTALVNSVDRDGRSVERRSEALELAKKAGF